EGGTRTRPGPFRPRSLPRRLGPPDRGGVRMNAQSSRRRIAMVSEHASPLALLGGVDAGGQNVAVAELSAALAAQGHEVVVYTRRDDTDLLDRVDTEHGYAVV